MLGLGGEFEMTSPAMRGFPLAFEEAFKIEWLRLAASLAFDQRGLERPEDFQCLSPTSAFRIEKAPTMFVLMNASPAGSVSRRSAAGLKVSLAD
jgi:hypothetical protein